MAQNEVQTCSTSNVAMIQSLPNKLNSAGDTSMNMSQ